MGKAKKHTKTSTKQSKTSSKATSSTSVETPISMETPILFEPITIRGTSARNRIWLPPMCMYSVTACDGRPTDFHYQHYVSRALGGFGLIIVEATAVTPEGRISPCDLGLWEDGQIGAYRWIVDGMKRAGATPAIQIGHAGRKASTGCFGIGVPGEALAPSDGGWRTVAPSAIAFGDFPEPRALTVDEIHDIEDRFRDAAWRAQEAGFEAIEIHAAHGYLLSEFLDPLTNVRNDEYGGSPENRARMLIEIVDKVRGVVRDDMPVFVRISATDWVEGGFGADDAVTLAKTLKAHGVDLVDVSTGGVLPHVTIPVRPGYQVSFADRVRNEAGIATTAVGLITKPRQALKILTHGQADAVEIGRAALREPYWPLRAAAKLGMPRERIDYPPQLVRGAWRDGEQW